MATLLHQTGAMRRRSIGGDTLLTAAGGKPGEDRDRAADAVVLGDHARPVDFLAEEARRPDDSAPVAARPAAGSLGRDQYGPKTHWDGDFGSSPIQKPAHSSRNSSRVR
ncbi:hypothetical protein GCM10028799_81330 [Kribbella italica]